MMERKHSLTPMTPMKKLAFFILAVGLGCFLIGYVLKIDMRLRLRQSARLFESRSALDAQKVAEVASSFFNRRGVRFLIAQMNAQENCYGDVALANLISIQETLAGRKDLTAKELLLKQLIDRSAFLEKCRAYSSSSPRESIQVVLAAKVREYETRTASAPLDIWVAQHNGVPGIFTADVRLNSRLLAAILENRRQKGGNPPLRIRAEDGIGTDFLLHLVEQGISTGLTNITILLKQDLGRDFDMLQRRLATPDQPCYE
jgi:hypothetical protein